MTKTRRFLAIIMVVAMLCSMFSHTVFANATTVAEGTAGDTVTWVLDSEGTLTISGTGALPYLWATDTAWSEYNDVIKSIVVGEGITSAEGTAFYGAKYAETLYLPSTLTYIESHVFGGDYIALKEIIVAEENTTYKSIDGVLFTEDETTIVCYPPSKEGAEYTIPSSVTTISDEAFICNQTLEKIVIPDTVTNIENYSFAYSNAKSIEVGNGVKTLSYRCFYGAKAEKVIVSDSVTAIEEYVFQSMYYLETLVLGSGIETIGEDVIELARELTTIHYHGTQEDWDKITIAEQSYEGYSFDDKELHFVAEKEGFDATCGDGHTAGLYCEECDEYLTGDVIEGTGEHTYDDGVVTAPDCTEQGYTTYTCECGYTYTDDIEELGHNFVDGVCDVCGEPCTHIDDDKDEICDECGVAVPMDEATEGETETATIPENGKYYVKFTPDETGYYVIESFGDEYDPKVYLYDEDGDEIEYDDDGGDDYNFRLVFEATAGETYYFEMIEYDGYEAEIEYSINKYCFITHQPTSGEPYVELNWDVEADYQWYSLNVDENAEATDENAEAYSYNGEKATYDEENGWTPVIDSYNDYSSVTLVLNAGDVVTIEFAEGGFGVVGIYDFETRYGDYSVEQEGELTYRFTAQEDGCYTVYTSSFATHKVYGDIVKQTEISDETEATLKNPEIGKKYRCEVTLADDTVLRSDSFEYIYAITHQPTADEPYVELNDDTDATYQWYSVTKNKVEVTDENAYATDYYNGSEYDAESGWSGDFWDDGGAYFFGIELEKGDVIYLDFGEAVDNEIGIWDNSLSDGAWELDGTTDGKIEFIAPWDGYFEVYAYGISGETRVKAYIDVYEYTEIEGATDDTCAATEEGIYACKVTFVDDSTEMSIAFEKVTVPENDDDINDDVVDDTTDNKDNNAGKEDDKNDSENVNPAPNPDIPDTDAVENVNVDNNWFAALITMSVGVALVMSTNKKKLLVK